MEHPHISRRRVLGGALGSLLAAGAAGEALAGNVKPQHWDETYDVVIVGSGFAGLSAAYEAVKQGATPL